MLISLVTFLLLVHMVCRNVCLRPYASTPASGRYSAGSKYCRRCECYFVTKAFRCECCGMQLRDTPTERKLKKKLSRKVKGERKRKLKLELGIALKPHHRYN